MAKEDEPHWLVKHVVQVVAGAIALALLGYVVSFFGLGGFFGFSSSSTKGLTADEERQLRLFSTDASNTVAYFVDRPYEETIYVGHTAYCEDDTLSCRYFFVEGVVYYSIPHAVQNMQDGVCNVICVSADTPEKLLEKMKTTYRRLKSDGFVLGADFHVRNSID